MNEKDETRIINEVNVVFHLLASINLKEPLKDAVEVNMIFTQKIIRIVKKLKNLKSFVHISTIFVNSFQEESNEVTYKRSLGYKDLIEIASRAEDSSQFNHDFPNSYCLTKHYAEKLVEDEASCLPVVIFRLPTVSPSYKTLPGWTDNINNCSGLVVGMSKGFIHVWIGQESYPANSATVDFCVNAIAVAAWDVSLKYRGSHPESFSIPIINFISNDNNPSMAQHMDYVEEFSETPFENSIYYCSCIRTSSRFCFVILFFLLSTLPAFLADVYRLLSNKKRRYLRISKNLKTFLDCLEPIFMQKFDFENDNAKALIRSFKDSKSYRDELNFDFDEIDWREVHRNWKAGLKQYFFNEDMSRCPELAKSYQRKKIIHYVVKFLFSSLILWSRWWLLEKF
jgi:alcohol-forming fatty acyl-CoA reductase